MIFLLFANVERGKRTALLETHQRHRARQWAAAQLDTGDGLTRRQAVECLEHELAHQRVALGGEDRLLAVDEEVALPTGSQRHLLLLERALLEKRDEAGAGNAHPVRVRRAAPAPLLQAGTPGRGGPRA